MTSSLGVAVLVSSGIAAPSPPLPHASVSAHFAELARPTVSRGWSAALHTSAPTELVGFEWDGPADAGLEVRAADHGSWSPWIPVDSNADEGPDASSPEYHGSHTTAGPFWIGEGRRDIQVRVVTGAVHNLRVATIHSAVEGASTGQSWNPWMGLGPRPAEAEPAAPAIITRAQWGADESWRTYAPGCDGHPEYAPTVRNAFIHHTDNSNTYTPEQSAALVRGIYWFHTHTNQWCDIGYNFLVDRFGQVFEGRYGGVSSAVVGAHAGGYNTGSTGVALIGEFQHSSVPPAMYAALRRLLAWKFGYHGIDAGGQLMVTAAAFDQSRFTEGSHVVLPTIAGHRDVDVTDCPGDHAYSLLDQLRADVQYDVTHTVPYPFGGWHPAATGPAVVTLDAFGGIHPAGAEPALPHSAFWPGWDIARGIDLEGQGGYVVDGWGGLHQFGDAPPVVSALSTRGRDLARGIARGPTPHSGWVLDAWGGIHPFGGAPPVLSAAYWPGWDIARGIGTAPTGTGGYVVDGWGGVHPFGAAPPVFTTAGWPGWDIARGIALRPDGASGYVVDGWGGVHPFGAAPAVTSSAYFPGQDFARGLTLTADGDGGWVLDGDGRLWPFGDAPPVTPSLTWGGLNLGRAVA